MATKVQVNWTGVSFGSSISITRVTNMSVSPGGTVIKFKGDTDLYPTVIVAADVEPHASITSADIGTLGAIAPGTTNTLTATLLDAKGITTGNVLFTLSNAVFENVDAQAAHAQFGSCTATWQCFSTDGVTNPYSISG